MASTKKTIMLFLLALFFVLAISISAWMSNIYKSASSYSNRTAKGSVACAELALSGSIVEFDPVFIFSVKNENFAEASVEELIVVSGEQKRNIRENIAPGEEKTFELSNFTVVKQVLIYPKNCEKFKMLCDMTDKTCSRG